MTEPDPEKTPPTGDDGDNADDYREVVDKDGMGGQSTDKNGHGKGKK